MKKCGSCNEIKSTKEFGKNKNRKDGFHSYCRDCTNQKGRERLANESEDKKKARRERQALKMREKRAKNPEAFAYVNIKTPEEHRVYRLFNRYGLTENDCQEILESQNGLCLICSIDIRNNFVVDHDHNCCSGPSRKTCGKCVRGFLCPNCNKKLGFIESNENWLTSALDYLSNNNK